MSTAQPIAGMHELATIDRQSLIRVAIVAALSSPCS
jgi:hypothetical protein